MYGGRHAGVLFTPPGPLVSALSYTLAKWGVQPIFHPEGAESRVFSCKIQIFNYQKLRLLLVIPGVPDSAYVFLLV